MTGAAAAQQLCPQEGSAILSPPTTLQASPRPVQTRGQVGVWAPGSSWAGQEERWGLLSTLPPGPSPPSSTTAPESLQWGLHTSWGHMQLLSKPQEQLHGNSMKLWEDVRPQTYV